MLKGVEGGIRHVLEALRAHDDDDAQAFIELADSYLLVIENMPLLKHCLRSGDRFSTPC